MYDIVIIVAIFAAVRDSLHSIKINKCIIIENLSDEAQKCPVRNYSLNF